MCSNTCLTPSLSSGINGVIGVIGLLGERKRRGLRRRSLDISSGKREETEVRGTDIRIGPYIPIGAGSEPRRWRGVRPAATRRYTSTLRTEEVIDSDWWVMLLTSVLNTRLLLSGRVAQAKRASHPYLCRCSCSSGSYYRTLVETVHRNPAQNAFAGSRSRSRFSNLKHIHIARRA